ncbi:adenylosuccinate lyase, partial [bacterium]|nr:adenylosuccinate lyase [bacterium]
TEVGEISEPFTKGQKGSSAMPHKKNPIVTERITGMARLLRANAHAALENIALWHERDISHSSVERVIIPDSFHLAVYMLSKMSFIIAGMVVEEEKMAENLALTQGLCASSGLLVELIKSGLARTQAYEVIAKHAAVARAGKKNFRQSLENDSVVTKHLNLKTIERCFDPKPRYVDETFHRLGLREG